MYCIVDYPSFCMVCASIKCGICIFYICLSYVYILLLLNEVSVHLTELNKVMRYILMNKNDESFFQFS